MNEFISKYQIVIPKNFGKITCLYIYKSYLGAPQMIQTI